MKYILISGPPGAGKDTLVDMIFEGVENTDRVWREKFATPLMLAAKSLGFDMDDAVKDKLDPKMGISRRKFQILFSERLCKPKMGKKVFGHALVGRTRHIPPFTRYVLVSDSGFKEEALAVVDSEGIDNVVRVHVSRDGCNYDNDSRSDWQCPEGMVRIDVSNDGTMEELQTWITDVFCKEYLCV